MATIAGRLQPNLSPKLLRILALVAVVAVIAVIVWFVVIPAFGGSNESTTQQETNTSTPAVVPAASANTEGTGSTTLPSTSAGQETTAPVQQAPAASPETSSQSMFLPLGTETDNLFVGVGTYSEATRERTENLFRGIQSLADINKLRDGGALTILIGKNIGGATSELPSASSLLYSTPKVPEELGVVIENPQAITDLAKAFFHPEGGSQPPITKFVVSQPNDFTSPEGGTRFNVAIHRAYSYGEEEVATYQALVFPKGDAWAIAEFRRIS